jgi:VCBS repeat-containing protein
MKIKDFIYVSSNSKFEITYASAGEVITEVFTSETLDENIKRLGHLIVLSLKAVNDTFVIKASI